MTPVEGERKRPRILVVDDSELNRVLTGAILDAVGEVECVGDAASALKALDRDPYDLVLMDIDMPEQDGHAATDAIRRRPGRIAATKVVAFSARHQDADRQRSSAIGMDGHLARPIKPHDLVAAVETLLRPRIRGEVWRREDYDGLVARLGGARMNAFLSGLLDQVRQLARDLAAEGPRADGVLHQAHDVASTSGMMGFLDLSQCCQGLLAARLTSPGAERPQAEALTDALRLADAEIVAALGTAAAAA